jgi:hypothetical protein
LVSYIGSYFIGAEETPSRKKPLIFVDVNLGTEKGKHKLIVYENESPHNAAKKFAELHGIIHLLTIV